MTVSEAFESIRHIHSSSRMAHGYIIEGDPSGNAAHLANMIVQLLLCRAKKAPCGVCQSCKQVSDLTHPDLLRIEPQKKSRQIVIEQIRVDLLPRMSQTAFLGGWKACVISSADRMNASAANAFLKMLEEPPELTAFFLLTDNPQALLPTILSRCQRISLSADDSNLRDEWRDAVLNLLQEDIPKSHVTCLGRAEALGRILKSVKEAATDYEEELAKKRRIVEDTDDETADARAEARYREWRRSIMRCVLGWYRDILLLVTGADPALVINTSREGVLRKKSAATTLARAMRNVQIVESMGLQMDTTNLIQSQILNFGFLRLSQ